MKNKDIIKVINEEISEYDFLNNDKERKSQEDAELIKNEDFQKQFLIDSVLKREKIKLKVTDAKVTGDWESHVGDFNIEYYTEVEYKFDSNKSVANFILSFDGSNVSFSTKKIENNGDYLTQPTTNQWFDNIDWTDIAVGLSTFDGDQIDFTAYNNAPEKIKEIFVRGYLEEFMIGETKLETNN